MRNVEGEYDRRPGTSRSTQVRTVEYGPRSPEEGARGVEREPVSYLVLISEGLVAEWKSLARHLDKRGGGFGVLYGEQTRGRSGINFLEISRIVGVVVDTSENLARLEMAAMRIEGGFARLARSEGVKIMGWVRESSYLEDDMRESILPDKYDPLQKILASHSFQVGMIVDSKRKELRAYRGHTGIRCQVEVVPLSQSLLGSRIHHFETAIL